MNIERIAQGLAKKLTAANVKTWVELTNSGFIVIATSDLTGADLETFRSNIDRMEVYCEAQAEDMRDTLDGLGFETYPNNSITLWIKQGLLRMENRVGVNGTLNWAKNRNKIKKQLGNKVK